MIFTILLVLPPIFLPTFVKMFQNSEFDKFKTVIILTVTFIIAVAIFTLSVCYYFGTSVITFLFASEYTQASFLLTPLTLGVLFYGGGLFFQQMLLALNQELTIVTICLGISFLNLIWHYIFTSKYGAVAAAYTTLATNTVYMLSCLSALLFLTKNFTERRAKHE